MLSESAKVKYGVPQGSILGPLLFIVFVNDLPEFIRCDRIHLYADDTAITINGASPEKLENKFAQALGDAIKWMSSNRLTLNLKKTMAMCFGTHHTLSQVSNLEISHGNMMIQIVDEYKYLGIMVDPKLSFTKHAEYMKSKSVGRLRMLSKLRPILSENSALTLYKTLIAPIFDYGDIVYDALCKRDSDCLQKLQNRALRIILKSGKRAPTREMHQTCKLNYLSDRRKIHAMQYMCKVENSLVPPAVESLFY